MIFKSPVRLFVQPPQENLDKLGSILEQKEEDAFLAP